MGLALIPGPQHHSATTLHTPIHPHVPLSLPHSQGAPQAAAAAAWLKSHPLSSTPNAQAWNGGLGADQIAWLRKQLADAAAAGERVIVACHHPLAPGSAPEMYLAWDHDKIRAILEEKPGVVALAVSCQR